MKNSNYRYIFLIIFIFLGVAISVQIKSTLYVNAQKAAAVKKLDDYKKILNKEISVGDELKKSIERYEKLEISYLKAAVEDKNDEELNQLMKEWKKAKLQAGLTDVKGPGLVVKLDDAPYRTDEDPRDIILHDIDIIRILNEIKKAGAQAISINGERIVATSEQVCAGPTIRINRKRYAVPYEINAVGNPDILEKGLKESEIYAIMLEYRIRVEISKVREITIPKYEIEANGLTEKLEVIDR